MISPRAKALFDQYRLLRPPMDAPFDLQAIRQATVDAEDSTAIPEGVRFRKETIDGVPAIRCRPPGERRDFEVIYLHGGAFCLMSAKTHARMAGHLALYCRADVWVPDYGLAPEHPFPRGIVDALKVIRARQKAKPERPLALIADSSGGAMAMASLIRMRDLGERLPICAVLMCAWLDLTLSSPSVRDNAHVDVILRERNLRNFAKLYLGDGEPASASPMFAECRSLPPIYLQAAQNDLLRDDSTRFADRITASGGAASLEVFPDMQHCFQFYAGRIPEADDALRKASRFIGDAFERLPQGSP